MAKHGFGIMQEAPQKGVRYEGYEPQRYDCISVNDDDLEHIIDKFMDIQLYWHTVDVPAKGIAYTGITLIAPEATAALTAVINGIPELSELKLLLERAGREHKWLIHFGL